MNAAVEHELIDINPVQVKAAAHAQVARERDPAPLPIPILFRVADAMPERLRLGVLLGGVLGMRSGEVPALQRRDFTLNQAMPTVTVSRAVKEAEGGGGDVSKRPFAHGGQRTETTRVVR